MPDDEELIMISSLLHLEFCERRWSLIQLESEWRDNVLTAEGRVLHERVHSEGVEHSAGVVTARALWLKSERYGIYGVADIVEFIRSDDGVPVPGHRGKFIPYPVEYKRGKKRPGLADEIQVAAQAVCLEDMFGIAVTAGAVYYGTPRRRNEVLIDAPLRERLAERIARARELSSGTARPQAKIGRHCQNCSLAEVCMPGVIGADRSAAYVAGVMKLADGRMEAAG